MPNRLKKHVTGTGLSLENLMSFHEKGKPDRNFSIEPKSLFDSNELAMNYLNQLFNEGKLLGHPMIVYYENPLNENEGNFPKSILVYKDNQWVKSESAMPDFVDLEPLCYKVPQINFSDLINLSDTSKLIVDPESRKYLLSNEMVKDYQSSIITDPEKVLLMIGNYVRKIAPYNNNLKKWHIKKNIGMTLSDCIEKELTCCFHNSILFHLNMQLLGKNFISSGIIDGDVSLDILQLNREWHAYNRVKISNSEREFLIDTAIPENDGNTYVRDITNQPGMCQETVDKIPIEMQIQSRKYRGIGTYDKIDMTKDNFHHVA